MAEDGPAAKKLKSEHQDGMEVQDGAAAVEVRSARKLKCPQTGLSNAGLCAGTS